VLKMLMEFSFGYTNLPGVNVRRKDAALVSTSVVTLSTSLVSTAEGNSIIMLFHFIYPGSTSDDLTFEESMLLFTQEIENGLLLPGLCICLETMFS
jgi:hypothetical protein